ncbi:MAG: carboxymuconolactone decarboxylase family protein [bacterium]|nr:carboxymuconolactone decarboxylase family protein [Gammaproteobacteria bacterium]HIL95858.1 carboxymuconolactone decarboxylase family protein [Pseudomonadales bacterium]
MTSRLQPKSFDELTTEQQAQYERITKTRSPRADGQLGGPFDPWIRSPEVAQRAMSLGNFVWERTAVGRRIVELAIIVTGRHWRSNVEWVAHSKMAKAEGVSDEVIQSVFDQVEPPADAPDDEKLTIEVCRAIHDTKDLPLPLYKAAIEQWGETGLMDIIQTIGFYSFVSMTLNTFNIPTAEGDPTPFPRSDQEEKGPR